MTPTAHPCNYTSRRHAGFTLVELLVSLVTGLMLAGALIAIMVGSTSAYTVQVSRARVYENARFALEFLARDLRMAGYFGCVGEPTAITNNLQGYAATLYDHRFPLEGYEHDGADDTWRPSGLPVAGLNPLEGSDAITVRFTNPTLAARVERITPPLGPVYTSDQDHRFDTDNIVVISDCDKADIFQVTGISRPGRGLQHARAHGTPPGNRGHGFGDRLGGGYDASALVMRYNAARYYVARRDPDNDSPDAPVALHRQYLADSGAIISEDLVEGVENLQLLYGEDTDGDGAADTYLPADRVGNWPRVVSVRIALLVRSSEEYGSGVDVGSTSHQLLGETITDVDGLRVRRHRFSTTVTLRNRL